MNVIEINTNPSSQINLVQINGLTYTFRIVWRGSYILDILYQNTPLVQGIALVTGQDLLGPYKYLGLGHLILANDDLSDDCPTYSNLGQTCHLLYVS